MSPPSYFIHSRFSLHPSLPLSIQSFLTFDNLKTRLYN